MLSYRLQQIADRIKKFELLADIGTDHAYIPIYAVKKGLTKRAIAADISKGSCKKARLNINSHHLSDLIDVRQGNGLEVIKEGENPDTIVITGMGGLLTINVLESGKNAVSSASQLILQPQRDIDKVRRYVHSIGFKITYESIFKEGDKFYTLLDCEKGKESYSDIEYLFGKIPLENKSPILKEYAVTEYDKLLIVLDNMERNSKQKDENYKRISELKNKYKEVIECL